MTSDFFSVIFVPDVVYAMRFM